MLSIDVSETMMGIASAVTGQEARVLHFQEIDFVEEFDGIWACGSLLHVPRSEMPGVFEKLATAVKPTGVIYVSFKVGEQDEIRDGRLFTNYTECTVVSQTAITSVLKLWRIH